MDWIALLQIMHIASHFKFDPANGNDSYLLLGDGSHLPLKEIGKMKFTNVRVADVVGLRDCTRWRIRGQPWRGGREPRSDCPETRRPRGTRNAVARG